MPSLEELQNQIAQLQRQAEQLITQQKAEVIEDIKAKIKTYGITAKELGLGDKTTTHTGIVVPIKYRLNEHTWTGRGRQPKWVEDYLAAGGNLEDVAAK